MAVSSPGTSPLLSQERGLQRTKALRLVFIFIKTLLIFTTILCASLVLSGCRLHGRGQNAVCSSGSLIKDGHLSRQGPSQAGSLALYDPPPVVTPGKQPSPGGGQGQVLIVAAGEQDVLPAWGLL